MRKSWPVLMIAILLVVLLQPSPVNGASASIDVEEDDHYISVDPSDEDQGYLEIYGTVDGSQIGILDQLTVTLSVNITEEYDGEPTGRYWAASAEFEGETVTPEETRLTYNKDTVDFTIFIDPELSGQGDGDIAVPPGISPLTEGKLVLKLAYSGASSGEDIERMTIIPDYYHLINLSTPTTPLEVKAGNRVNYTLRIKNAGNQMDSVTVEVPDLEDLESDGWTTSLSLTDIDDMEPGFEERSILLLTAPNDIPADRDLEIDIRVFTDELDPDTLEPVSSAELTLTLQLKKSKVQDPIVDDDDDDDNDTVIDDDTNIQATDSPYAIIGVTAAMAVIALIVLIVLFSKRGGGDDDEDEDDMHTSMVRI
ncbi:MAG: hypothetical protein ACMUHM_09225 [Thermoplasmatota archaeon]